MVSARPLGGSLLKGGVVSHAILKFQSLVQQSFPSNAVSCLAADELGMAVSCPLVLFQGSQWGVFSSQLTNYSTFLT